MWRDWLFPTWHFTQSSVLQGTDRDTVWRHMTDMRGVNEELMPWIYMTYPSDLHRLSAVSQVALGKQLFISTLCLFGLFPIDLHFLSLDDIRDHEGFDENSTSLLQSHWRHKRHIRDNSSDIGVEVVDELSFQPRLPLIGYLLYPVIRGVFFHRHQQLRRKFIRHV